MKLLVISLAGIGDTLFATPLIHELRASFPDATLDALVLWPGSRDVLAGNPHLNAVHQKNLIASSKMESFQFLRTVGRRGYDISINTHPQSRMHYRWVARVIGAKQRLSHDYDHTNFLDRLLVNETLPQDYGRHSIENNLALLKLLGATPRLPKHAYELFLSTEEEQWAAGYLSDRKLAGRRLLALHVGSGGTKNLALRRWPVAHYVELLRAVGKRQPDVTALLMGGPEERVAHEAILSEVGNPHVLQPETRSLRQAAALIKRCHLFLSVDTALMHVAAAVGVPRQIVIETPTLNKTVEPYGHPFVLVPNPAVGGRNLGYYRYDGRGIRGSPAEIVRCMESVSVEAVLEAVTRTLAET